MPDAHTPDVSETAARVVRKSAAKLNDPTPPAVEAAWSAWSRSIAKMDARTMALLRAAFEAGAEAGARNGTPNAAGAALAKLGASKGGKARAKKLSPTKRKAIAKMAAARRWSKRKG